MRWNTGPNPSAHTALAAARNCRRHSATVRAAAALVIEARPQPTALPTGPGTGKSDNVPSPALRSVAGRLRVRLNRALTERIRLNGHANGYNENGQPDRFGAHAAHARR